ncbi:MAG TPA: hypothetical protein VMB78_09440 [Dissulfurispiraceae bacterium]|nr:hypothetical protein [Dissulfurispiraceae bacterium]
MANERGSIESAYPSGTAGFLQYLDVDISLTPVTVLFGTLWLSGFLHIC